MANESSHQTQNKSGGIVHHHAKPVIADQLPCQIYWKPFAFPVPHVFQKKSI